MYLNTRKGNFKCISANPQLAQLFKAYNFDRTRFSDGKWTIAWVRE